MNAFFITGTDTEVGKTVVARALLQAMDKEGRKVAGYKPVAVRNLETNEGVKNSDALVIQTSANLSMPYENINPLLLSEEELNTYTHSIDYSLLSNGLEKLSQKSDNVIVEGIGGWNVLLGQYQPFSQWVVHHQLPVILVVGIKLGCINHALLTAKAIQEDGLPLVGWITNRINPCLSHYAQTVEALRHILPAPQIGEIPYLPKAEQRDLSGYINLSALR